MIVDSLRVTVVYSPRFAEGANYARPIVDQFQRLAPDRERTPSLVVTRVRCAERRPDAGPRSIDWDAAHCHLVVVLCDMHLVDDQHKDKGWGVFFDDIARQHADRPERIRVVPIAVTGRGRSFPRFDELQGLHVDDFRGHQTLLGDGKTANKPMRAVLIQLLSIAGQLVQQMLQPTPDGRIPLFISYTRNHGGPTADAMYDRLVSICSQRAQVRPFLDRRDLEIGHRYMNQFEKVISNGVFLALCTDDYASRRFTRWEMRVAKKERRPILVVHLLLEGQVRTDPFGANTPLRVLKVREVKDPERDEALEVPSGEREIDLLLLALLAETLRMLAFELDVAMTASARGVIPAVILGRPPELADLAVIFAQREELASERRVDVVYPDPPLDRGESELVAQVAHPLRVVTLSEFRAGGAPPQPGRYLDGKLVGIGVSDVVTPQELKRPHELARLGFQLGEDGSSPDIDIALAQCATVVASLGARIGYGGDLRGDGYAKRLFAEVADAYYVVGSDSIHEPYVHYLSWSAWRKVRDGEPTIPQDDLFAYLAENRGAGRIQLFLSDGSALTIRTQSSNEDDVDLEAFGSEGLAATLTGPVRSPGDLQRIYEATGTTDEARALTRMREVMASQESARIVLGGKTIGYAGAMPGVFEEAIANLDTPGSLLLVCGGYGGAARDIALALGLLDDEPPRSLDECGPGYADAFAVLRQRKDLHRAELERRGIPWQTARDLAATDHPIRLAQHLREMLTARTEH